MPRRVIESEDEVRRWVEEGRTYAWMVDEYARKYQRQVSMSAFTNLRARRGWPRREIRNSDLIPWEVSVEHRWAHEVMMLRAEARVRAGEPLAGRAVGKHASFTRKLKEQNLVVSYNQEDGFRLVPRVAGDRDIIREPSREGRTRRHPVD